MSRRNSWLIKPGSLALAFRFGIGHLAVEFACSSVLTLMLASGRIALTEITTYNVAAFCTQPLIGSGTDRWHLARHSSVVGYGVVLCGVAAALWAPSLAIVLLGVGNACFHVGAGSQCLEASGNRFGPLGLFVGPGALGLVLGKFCGPTSSLGVIGCCVFGAFLGYNLFHGVARCDDGRADRNALVPRTAAVVCCGLTLCCITVRSLIGSTVEFAWDDSAAMSITLGFALCAGKMTGGLFADCFGGIRTAIAAIGLSVPLLVVGATAPVVGLLGAALFQFPMAVTLGLLASTLPGRPGLAFGLASAAIFLGPYAGAVVTADWLHSPAYVLICAGLSALLLLITFKIAAYRFVLAAPLRNQSTD